MNIEPGYEHLARVLQLALDQSQSGKGKERHANGQPFTSQPIMEIGRMVGIGYNLGQAMKKAQESTRLSDDAAKRELLGAINYLASAYLLIEESPKDAEPVADETAWHTDHGKTTLTASATVRRGEKEVAAFGEEILRVMNLPKNAVKGGWGHLPYYRLLDLLEGEVKELRTAYFNDSDMVSEVADVGAYATMIHDRLTHKK